ncbi:hypothetical protein TNCV_3235761 [Trichonephila clavipes]|nr:hypothetical protein TNCV_3235761 [Trichonephila clavipes]
MMLGMAKVEFNILLSGMMAIGWAMESGRRGYGSSSGWKVFEFLAWLRAKRLLSDWMLGRCHGSLVVMAGMSRVQAKYPPCRGTMHIKYVEFKRPPIGVVVRRGEFQLRCRP